MAKICMTEGDTVFEVVLAGFKTKLPTAVDGVLRIVGVRLLGAALSWPEAWFKDQAQQIKDRADARALIMKALAKEGGKQAIGDPEKVAAVIDLALGDQFEKIKNKAEVFRKTIEHAASTPQDYQDLEQPEVDWMNAFSRLAEDASSDEMRETFARVLSGEMKAKGTFSRSTLRVLNELDQQTARIFERVYALSINDGILLSLFESPLSFKDLRLLKDTGFIYNGDAEIPAVQRSNIGGKQEYEIIVDERLKVCYSYQMGTMTPLVPGLSVAVLSRMGLEISTILTPPDRQAALRAWAEKIAQDSEPQSVTLTDPDGTVEALKS